MHMAPKLHAIHDFSRHCRSQDLGMIRCARIRKDSARRSCLVRAQDNAATELFESALLLASPSERLLHEEWKRRDEGHPSSEVLYTSKFLDIPELCKATRLAFCKDQGDMAKLAGQVPSVQESKTGNLAAMVNNFDRLINKTGAVRPQRPHMQRMVEMESIKQVDSTWTGTGMICFWSSYFMLPGGSPAAIRRVFRHTFGIELPNFDQKFNEHALRMMAGVAAFQDKRFYLAYLTCWKREFSPYVAIMLVDMMLKTGAFKRESLEYRNQATPSKVRRLTSAKITKQKAQQNSKRGFGLRQTSVRAPAQHPASQQQMTQQDWLFPLRFYKKFKDLPNKKIIAMREAKLGLQAAHIAVRRGKLVRGWIESEIISPEFPGTVLGETQAPKGQWNPSMAAQGLIPHLDDVNDALDRSVSVEIRDLYWELAELPDDKKEEWVNLDDVTRSKEPMLVVAAQATWAADGTWRKLQADVQQWRIWTYLMAHSTPGFVVDLQARIQKLMQLHTPQELDHLLMDAMFGFLLGLESTDSKSKLCVRVVSVQPITLEVESATTGKPFVVPEEEKAQAMARLAAMLPRFVAHAQQQRLAREQQEKEREAAGAVRRRTLYVTKGVGQGRVGRHLPASRQQKGEGRG